MQDSTASSILMQSISGGDAGQSGVRDAINRMIFGFLPFDRFPHLSLVLWCIGGAVLLWIIVWYWFNFIR